MLILKRRREMVFTMKDEGRRELDTHVTAHTTLERTDGVQMPQMFRSIWRRAVTAAIMVLWHVRSWSESRW